MAVSTAKAFRAVHSANFLVFWQDGTSLIESVS